jgi:hypothetical protein
VVRTMIERDFADRIGCLYRRRSADGLLHCEPAGGWPPRPEIARLRLRCA